LDRPIGFISLSEKVKKMNNRTLAEPHGKTSRRVELSDPILDLISNTEGMRFAEFFAGIGLMRMGLEQEGWSVAYANDIDNLKKDMYVSHFGDDEPHFVVDDIHKISAASVPTVMLATASFPCNDLSLAGARRGLAGKQSSAFWGFVKVLHEMTDRRPPLILIENVPGFLTSHGGKDFREAMVALNQLGYAVDPFIIDAVSFVPQSRQRLFVVGILETVMTRESHQQIFPDSDLRPAKLVDFIVGNSDVQWAIRTLPSPRRSRKELHAILDSVPEAGDGWWSEQRAAYLLNQMSPRHLEIAKKMISGKEWSYGTVFRRVRNSRSMAELRVDGIAGCLRTPRGGSGRQILFKAGYGKYFVRLLNPRECARLMGAPDYTINVGPNQALFGFGDAVCVPVISWIARTYLKPVIQELQRGKAHSCYAKKDAAVA